MFIGRVTQTWGIKGRGLAVILDVQIGMLPSGLKLKIGDRVSFKVQNTEILRAVICGIEHSDPYTPKQLFSFLLPENISEEQVPIGSEVHST